MVHECDGHDHRFEQYATSDRRLLALVRDFDERLAQAAARGADLSKVLAALDPDPARYTDVGEGGGIVDEVLAEAEEALATAPDIPGFANLRSLLLPTSRPANRPAIASCPDGRLLASWIEWTEHEGEQVHAVLLDRDGRPLAEPRAVSGQLADCLRPSVVFDGDGTGWVFFGLRAAEGVAVFATREEGSGWLPPFPVSTTAHPSFNQEVALRCDGALECCWQGYAGGRFRIYTRTVGRSRLGDTRLVSAEDERNVWDPAVACDSSGRTCFGWTTYGERGYETALRMRETGGAESSRLIVAPEAYSLHPSLAFTPDGALWCAFDTIALGGHAGSGPTRLRTREEMAFPLRTGRKADGRAVPADLAPDVTAEVTVVRIGDFGHAAEPTGPIGVSTHVSPAGLPRIAATPEGSVAVAYRAMRRLPLMLYFWETVLEWHTPRGWGNLTTFDETDGPLEEPAVAAREDGVVASWQQDGRQARGLAWTEGFGGEECLALREHYGEVVWHTLHTGGHIRLGAVDVPFGTSTAAEGSSPAAAGAAEPRSATATTAADAPHSESRPWAVARRGGRGHDRSWRYRTTADGRDYGLYWGDLHRHSLISRCTAGDEPELDDFYRYSFDVCEYDFWAVTDHAENTSSFQWWSIQKLADVLNVEGRFVPFYGFEWTAATGHQNVIYESTRRDAPIYSSTAEATRNPAQLWSHLRRAGQRSLTIPHHPGSAMVPFDWSYRDEEMCRLVEVFQACRGNYEDDGCFRQYSDCTLTGTFVADGLRAGHRFGLISSSDHGNGASFVGAFATDLTRAAVFDALHGRRTIAATTRDVIVDFRLNGCFMGSEAPPAESVSIAAAAEGYCDVARFDLLRNGEVVHRIEADLGLAPSETAFPLRVEWAAGETGRSDWTGSLRVGGGRILETKYWSPEIVEVSHDTIRWTAETRNFRSQYGFQRGGVELTVLGTPGTTVDIVTASMGGRTTLGDVARDRKIEIGHTAAGTLALQLATGGLVSLGTSTVRMDYEEPLSQPGWYYARVILEDGEMAWSSPVWVSPS